MSGADFRARGRVFDRQLEELRGIWSGGGELGPPPADGRGPELLVGGSSDAAFRRAAAHGDGWTMGGGAPDMFAAALGRLHDAWRTAGREGRCGRGNLLPVVRRSRPGGAAGARAAGL